MGQNVLAKNFKEHNGILFAARESNNQPFGYKSTDDGLTWESLTSLLVPTISFFSESTNLWAGTVHAVWLSTDNGENWDLRENGLPPDPYNSWVIRVNGMLMSSLLNAAVFISTNEGINWEDYSQGLPTAISVRKLITYNDKNIAATSQGVWQRDTSEVITSLGNDISSLQEFNLLQNYPNPFNPSTKIKYLIPQSSDVLVKVYDVLGNEIETLVNEEKFAGTYEITWFAENLPSGVYFFQLKAGNFVQTKKMVLLR
jgi:hypothetical protein